MKAFMVSHYGGPQMVRASDVQEPQKGRDEVLGTPRKARMGAFAERTAIHPDDIARKPQTVSMVEAAAVPLVGLTAWQALATHAKRIS